ncbi:MAG TPA: CHASE3 domain-containing protein [Flavobacterium sp.]|jgi:hypothetical protein
MNIRDRFKPSIYLTVAFVVSLFLLFFIAGISFRQIKTLSASQDSVLGSLQIRVDLEKLFSELKDAETAHRDYLITKDDRYLEPFHYSQVKIKKSLLQIRELIGTEPNRQKDFDDLEAIIDLRFRGLRDNMSESRLMPTSSPEFQDKMWAGKRGMDGIRSQINKIIASENAILQKQEQQHIDEISFTPLTSVLLVIFSLSVFIFTYNRISRNLRELAKLNREWELVNDTFTYAERIGEICHWQYDTRTKELKFSDNKFSLLGFEPQSFVPTVENFLTSVHPHDRRKVRNIFLKELTDASYMMQYRIVRKDKKVRHIKSISKLTIDSDGNEIIIGVDCDITQQHRNIVKLEQKNLELKRSNEELLSFNHIVSHDLQEPLRKIQMFISRIDDGELAKLSEQARNYISRIHSSSNRAQKLIDDLLMYSRLNRSDKTPELTNLNIVLHNARADLSHIIDDKKAVIKSDPLPTINVIPYQIKQMFVNLISNSLKYAKADVPPEITILYNLADSRKTPELKKRIHRKYHQITISDNGIGFEQQYAERIFVLFHRLHDREKYSGTGIGLAICKKMAENHHGFIVAYGNLGEGATFKIFLPV